ncbi:MAG: ribosome silencing factor [Chloroflexota bacterium]
MNAASEKLASNIILLDMRGENRFADFFVICTAESPRQIGAIREEIHRVLKAAGVLPHHDEGTADSGWLLMDYGEMVVHVFSDSLREFYQLDKLWEDASTLVRIQ